MHVHQSILISPPHHLRSIPTTKNIPHSIDRNIRYSSHSSITKDSLTTKYNWTIQLMERINWEDHSTNMRKLYPSKKLLIRRCIHNRLPKGKMYFHNQSRFSYCNIMFTNRTHHHHFLTCIWTGLQKDKRVQSLSSTVIKRNTPPPSIIHFRKKNTILRSAKL